MKKWISFFLIFILGILISSGIYLYTNRAPFLAAIISSILEVEVRIKSIDISSDGFIIESFEIHNPPECQIRQAFNAERISVIVPFQDLFKNTACIRAILVQNPTLGIELFSLSGSDNNWKRILSNISSSTAPTNTSTTQSPEVDQKTWSVEHVLIQNIGLNVRNQAISKQVLHPPAIHTVEIFHLGTEKPMTLAEILNIIFRTMLNQATTSKDLKNIMQELKQAPQEILKKYFEKITTFYHQESLDLLTV